MGTVQRGRRLESLHSSHGATAVEYALMVALIAIVIVGAVIAIGASTSDAMCGPVPALGGAEGDC
jgi:Flp pilus assembly pilin Flp